MAKHIRKVDKTAGSFRIVIPKNIIIKKRWGNVSYVLVEDHHGDKLVIRRLIDDKFLEEENF